MKPLLSMAWLALVSFSVSIGFSPLFALLIFAQGKATLPMFALLFFGVPVCLLGGFLLLMAFAYGYARLLPATPSGMFRMFQNRGSLLWALNNAVPALYLKWFKPTLFLNENLRYLMLKAMGADVTPTSWVTSNVIMSDLKNIHIGQGVMVGELTTLAPSLQPRNDVLLVADLHIADHCMIGSQSAIMCGVDIGAYTTLQARVIVCPFTRIGQHTQIGMGSRIDLHCKIGNHVKIGKWCTLLEGTRVDDYAVIPSGSVVSGHVTVAANREKTTA